VGIDHHRHPERAPADDLADRDVGPHAYPGARAAFQPTHESLASREMVAEVPLTGLS